MKSYKKGEAVVVVLNDFRNFCISKEASLYLQNPLLEELLAA